MAILKHIASKNADYGEAERYLIFQHDEYTQKPILDDNGNMFLREEYYLDGINCDPFTFDAECRETNAFFHKNQSFNEIKSHHYIISFDPKDQEEHGLTEHQGEDQVDHKPHAQDSGAGKEKSYGLLTVAADAKCASREDTRVGQKKDHTLRQDRTVRMVFETEEKILKTDIIASGGIKGDL